MIFPSGQFRIFIYAESVDMRSGYDRLAYFCKEYVGMDPYSGAVFLFFNRTSDRVKIFFYDGTGSCIFMKRLEKGRFQMPELGVGSGRKSVQLPASELGLLLEGVDTTPLRRPPKPRQPQ